MSADKPEGFENTTEMAHSAGSGTRTEYGAGPDKDATAQSAFATEQEAKRIEKIRSLASSHRTAGTVTFEDGPPRQGTAGERAPKAP